MSTLGKPLKEDMSCVESDQLDYRELVQLLSSPPNFPTSVHLRNHLIAAYAARGCPVDTVDRDPWKTYRDYRRGVQVIAVGDVPRPVLKESRAAGSDNGQNGSDGIWGIVILFPAYSGWQELSTDAAQTAGIWHSMRLSLWLSSEGSNLGPVSIGNIHKATQAEEALLADVFHQWLPRAAHALATMQDPAHAASATEGITVDLFAVNEAWVSVLRRWTESGSGHVRLTRANPCMTFIKPESEALDGLDFPPGWQVSSMESNEDVVLVQSSNSLTFPRWYIENRKHISILVHDGLPNASISKTAYPQQRQPGSPVAWAYAHDDISVASLHVAEPYRRLGLGRFCVDAMAKKLIGAQKAALTKAGCSITDAQTPCLLDTEMHKGASRLFFEQQGFKGVAIATWGSCVVSKSGV